ncbi:hypothetical protein JZ751_013455 [Albula glossodonta]|uniref:Uncharacterized protein n=1 Tax=Albula glossodonta TaxID=121402 RepID=A0A8T2MLX4_9TELE|nr:hypothetical protein JZ751_013455 [Albula glossodonta]
MTETILCAIDQDTAMEGGGNRKKRAKSPSRNISPVPSHYSEPATLHHHTATISRVPRLPGERDRHLEDEDETLSLRSVPSVRRTLSLAPRVKRSRVFPNRSTSNIKLPPVTVEHNHLRGNLVVRGSNCLRFSTLPPVNQSRTFLTQSQDRPPSRGGQRPDTEGICTPQRSDMGTAADKISLQKMDYYNEEQGSKEEAESKNLIPGLHPAPRIAFHSPVVQNVFSITPDDGQQRRLDRARKPQPFRSLPSTIHRGGTSDRRTGAVDGHLLQPISEKHYPLCLVDLKNECKHNCTGGAAQGRDDLVTIELEITITQPQGYPRSHSPTQMLKSALRGPIHQRAYSQKLKQQPTEGVGCSKGKVALPREASHNGRCAQASAPQSHDKGRQEVLGCLWEEICLPHCPNNGLLQPLSRLPCYLHQQLFHSHMLCKTAIDVDIPDRGLIHSCPVTELDNLLLVPSPPSHLTPCSTLPERTVELYGSQGGALPKITMTCPTPSPKPPTIAVSTDPLSM